MLTFFALYGAAFILSFAVMLLLWIAYRTQRSGGIVDVGWCLCFILTAWAGFFIGDGDPVKRFIMTAMVTVWGGRLGWHLFLRYIKTPEDPRYAKMREGWGGDSSGMLFLMMFLFQGILVVFIATPIILVNGWATPEWTWWEFAGIAFWAIGVSGESYADEQLRSFKADPSNEGKICDQGLWKCSRHPNYFFEFIVWIGFFLFAYPNPAGLLAIVAPIAMYFLLVKGSGIPLSEAQSLKRHGEEYRAYQERTSAFFPWLPGPKS